MNPLRVEESPQRLNHFGALDEDLAHVRIHRQINVAAAIAGFDVLQSVPLLGQGKQVLYQERDLLDVYRQFVGTGAEEIAFHADVIAGVQQLVELKSLFANIVEPDIDLQPLAALLQMGKSSLSLYADGHQASGKADVHARRFEFGSGLGRIFLENLGNVVGGFVAIGIRRLPQRLDLLQFVSS